MMAIEATAERLKQELQQRLSALREETEKTEAVLAALNEHSGLKPISLQGDSWAHLGIVESAKRLLQEANNRPMTTRELADEMKRRGVQSKAKRFPATVYVVLRDSPHFFFNTKLEKWTLKPTSGDIAPFAKQHP